MDRTAPMFDGIDPLDDEFTSVDALAEELIDGGEIEFDYRMLQSLNWRLGRPTRLIRAELESYGLTLKPRPTARRIRGYTTNNHDRWYGPGSSKTHGGSGHEQIAGFAGQKG